MKKILKLGVLVILVLSLTNCSIFKPYANLSPLDKAKVSVETLSSWYANTHKTLEAQYQAGTDETKELLNTKVFPEMDKLKPLIIKHNKLVLIWAETNTQPEGLTGLVIEIEKIILGVIEVLQ
jgi:hypothetical protein